MSTKNYALIWFEGEDTYTLVDRADKTVLLTEAEALNDAVSFLRSEKDLDNAIDDVRYAISVELLEDLFGWEV